MRPLPRPRSLAPLLLLCLVAITPSGVAAPAGRPIVVENIRVGFADSFKVGTWTPVWVQARAAGEFAGTMEVVVDDESGTPTTFSQSARLAAGETKWLPSYTRPGSPAGGLLVRFVDEDGRRVAEADIDAVRPNNPARRVFSDDVAVLALGGVQGLEILPTLAGLNGGRTATGATNGAASVVEVLKPGGLDKALLPGRAAGYDAMDVVVVDTNDKEVMAALSVQGDALVQWVAQGGHLVVAVGSNWQAVRDSVLGPILPGKPAGTIPITGVRTIESYASATQQLLPENEALTIARLEGAESRGGKVLCSSASTPIVARGPYGFGRVTVAAIDVDQAPFSTWPDRGLFWVKALDLHPVSSANVGGNTTRSRLTERGVGDFSGLLRRSLEQFPGVRLVPFGWVAFFIFVYILLIGPGDYFFLRKVVKRMEYTWITFPLIVLVVSGLAYWAAYTAKGTALRVNQVDLIDVDLAAKLTRGATFLNVFSPENRDYDVAVVPLGLRGGPAPAGTEVRTSWFGAPEQGLRGMNGGGRSLGLGADGYAYAPVGRAESLRGVRVKIWSTKAFSTRWFAPAEGEPIVESDLAPVGLDRLAGTVTNRLGVTMKGAVLAFNTQVYYNLGDLAPGETKRIELTQDRKLSGHLKDLASRYAGAADPNLGSRVDRYALAQAILFRESDVSGGNALPSRPLHDLDLTGQLLLDRPMLVAEVERPGADLILGSGSATPRTERTTVLRVILPLAPPADAPKAAR